MHDKLRVCMKRQTLYSDKEIRGKTPVLQCEILCLDRELRRRNEDLGLDMDVEGEWKRGMITLDDVLFVYDNRHEGEPCTTIVFLGEESVCIRMSFDSFWQMYEIYVGP